ncbi:MAG TPA: sodium-dependent transporter [Solimonas sp.]|jgi:NSS family neurotransmitter:Na+ symporter|nr:sodium-dependent transporter [Solimonas sp.]
MHIRESSYGYWSSTRSFVWVAAGATIGIGNFARLPYLMSEYGGLLFLGAYLVALLVVGLPLLAAEWMLGRWMRDGLIAGFRRLTREAGVHVAWTGIGWLALASAILILSYYSVIAGWSLAYALRATAMDFHTMSAETAGSVFLQLAQDPERSLSWHTIFMVIVCIVVAQGVRDGIERAAMRLVPAAFTVALLLCGYTLLKTDARGALALLLEPDMSRFGWRGALEALHQAFFTLGLGIGAMLGLGSYLPASAPIKRLALTVLLMDAVFSLVAGLAVFACIYSAGLKPEPGLALMFQVFPRSVPPTFAGTLLAVGLYLAMFLITLTSATALLEPVTRYLMDRMRLTRVFAAAGAALLIWYLGLGTLLSFSIIADVSVLGRNFFEWVQWLSASWFAPLGGLLVCVLVVSVLPRDLVRQLWGEPDRWLFPTWFGLLRYPARIGLILVLLYAAGLLGWLASLWGF